MKKQSFHLEPKKVSVALGLTFAVLHAVWGLLVASGFGQWYADHVLSVHFLSASVAVNPVDWVLLAVGVVGAFAIGYVSGFVFALLWNKVSK